MHAAAIWSLCFGLTLSLAGLVKAQDRDDAPGGALSLTIANDFFALTDRNYTNGLALHYAFAPSDTPRLSYWIGDWLLGVGSDTHVRAGISVGHTIYTPADTSAKPAPPEQHPYAGYVFLRGTLLADHGDMVDSVALDLGLVGPAAGAEFVQNTFHDLIQDDPAQGWDSQINNEPIANLTVSRRWRVDLSSDGNGLAFDTVPMVSASLGNFRTEASAGAIFRVGQRLSADYGPLRIQSSLFTGNLAGRRKDSSWYFYVGAAGHAVARDITLDGNTFRDSANVEREPFVGEVSAGWAARIGQVRLSYSFVATTRLFEGENAAQRYAVVNLTVGF